MTLTHKFTFLQEKEFMLSLSLQLQYSQYYHLSTLPASVQSEYLQWKNKQQILFPKPISTAKPVNPLRISRGCYKKNPSRFYQLRSKNNPKHLKKAWLLTFCGFLIQDRVVKTVYRDCRSTSPDCLVDHAFKTQLHCWESTLHNASCHRRHLIGRKRWARLERKINTFWHYLFLWKEHTNNSARFPRFPALNTHKILQVSLANCEAGVELKRRKS